MRLLTPFHRCLPLLKSCTDARVVTARDGVPEKILGHGQAFHPAVPMTHETVGGNTITLDLGGGQFANYHHLKPGSLRVKAGDRVRRSQVLARVGDSGDAREPHLHFEVTTSLKQAMSEGVPYLIDRYIVKTQIVLDVIRCRNSLERIVGISYTRPATDSVPGPTGKPDFRIAGNTATC